MRTPSPTPTMVLIIPLILNTILPPETWAPMARAPEIVYRIGDEPEDDLRHGGTGLLRQVFNGIGPLRVKTSMAEMGYCDADQQSVNLSYASATGYLSSLSQIEGNSISLFSVRNITASSVSCPLPSPSAAFPCENQTMSSPWPLGQGISGVPCALRLAYSHHQLSLNESSDLNSVLFPFGLNESSYDHSLESTSTHRHSQVPSKSRPMKHAGSVVSRRMLRGNDSTVVGSLYHRIHRRPVLDSKKHILLATAAIVIGSILVGVLCTIAAILLWCSRNKMSEEVPGIPRTKLCISAPRRYSHHELTVATQGFADEVKIGRGGFGPVYRGCLGDQDRHVAIKVLSQGLSVQGTKEFEAEARVMTRLRHRNIVELVGWCDGPSRDLLLVYEFVLVASRVLTWSDRYKIALGVGSAILYLHTECKQCVVHGDIKPANIMLDGSYNAKLGDFGLARFVDHGADPRTTQVVAGTLGYIDPEFVNSRRPSAESDVYSFGVVLLEIASGRRPTTSTQQSSRTPALVNWVRHMHRQDSILGAADRRLDGEFVEWQMNRVLVTGLWCTHQDQSQRPSIAQAMDVLRREEADLPVFRSEIQTADAVRSLEETAYGDLSREEEEHASEDPPAETEYHTSVESTYLLA